MKPPPEGTTPTVWRAFWTSRLVVLFVGLAGVIQVGVASRSHRRIRPGRLTAPWGYLANAVVAPLARWDSVWYLTIAKSGYAGSVARMAFFPLYPLLIHVVGFVTRSDLVAGVLISLVAFAVRLGLLYRLVRLDFSEEIAEMTVMLLAFCPMSFFFSAVYTESLFLALSVGSIYAARRERWLSAGVLGGLAAISRNGGIALILPVGVIYLYGPRTTEHARPTRWAREQLSGLRLLLPRYRLRPDAVWLLLIPAGLGVYLAYLGIEYGHALAPFNAEQVLVPPLDVSVDDDLARRRTGLERAAPAGPRPHPALLRAGIRPGRHRRRPAGRLPLHVPRPRRGRVDRRRTPPAGRVLPLHAGAVGTGAGGPREPAAARVAAALRDGRLPVVHLGRAVRDAPPLEAPGAGVAGGDARAVHGRVRNLAMGRLSRSSRRRPVWGPGRVQAVLLDAFGTLVTLDAPAPRLRALLAERLDVTVTEAQAAEALAAEVSFYRAHMYEGIDVERVAQLHARCAIVLRQALPRSPQLDAAAPGSVTAILLDTLQFSAYHEVPDVLARLRDAGLRLVVASNWDASLDVVLDRVGLLDAVDGVVNSATVGAAKPDPRLLQSALLLAGVEPSAAVHVGDNFREDVGAAFGAGVRPVLVSRDGRAGEVEYGPEEPTLPELELIHTLAGLPELLGV